MPLTLTLERTCPCPALPLPCLCPAHVPTHALPLFLPPALHILHCTYTFPAATESPAATPAPPTPTLRGQA